MKRALALPSWWLALLPAAVLLLFTLLLGGLWLATLSVEERDAFTAQLGERVALLAMLIFVLALAGGAVARRLHERWVGEPQRMAEQARALLAGGQQTLPESGTPATRAVAAVINQLVQQRSELEAAIDDKVLEASRGVEQERARLAALMAELQQAVVVCNLDGRILLYNRRARLQFRALSAAPAAGGAELIGIGRSIHAVLDRSLVAHALEGLVQRLQRGVAHPSSQFVTHTRGGQLLRVNLAAVREVGTASGDDTLLAGYVLMIENITREFAEDSERDRQIARFTEAARASIGSLQAAVELLAEPGLGTKPRERLQRVVRDETAAMVAHIGTLAAHGASQARTRWPLEDVQGADLLAAARRRVEALADGRLPVTSAEVDLTLWLRVDSYSLLRALEHLASRLLQRETPPSALQLRLQPQRPAAASGAAADAASPATARVELDLIWSGPGPSADEVSLWQHEPLAEGAATVSLNEVVERHGGAFWLAADSLRFLLPRAVVEGAGIELLEELEGERGERGGRPAFYDFDLFGGAAAPELAQWAVAPLASLAFTIFDCETTGLEPGAGDKILQIGATRIVAGKLRRQECFEQLVDPQRSIPEAGIAIHGIRPEMVAGAPTIGPVLEAFHAFAADTVLVAHNAAFDMRFLQLEEATSGVRFAQPVLDTLLLAEVAQPQQASHSLEAIASRLGVSVLGRHTALGDALVTAEVFLKLLPLLEQQGVRTLAQALEASRETLNARLAY